jgi:hypothetical protein
VLPGAQDWGPYLEFIAALETGNYGIRKQPQDGRRMNARSPLAQVEPLNHSPPLLEGTLQAAAAPRSGTWRKRTQPRTVQSGVPHHAGLAGG